MRFVTKRIDRALRWVRRRERRAREAHGVVLMYHRVAAARIDPWRLCVSPDRFESQIRSLSAAFDLVPLCQLRNELRAGRGTRPCASITFDDGYLDNLTVAKPILERYAVPATVFIATGYVGRRESFWWDRLAASILPEGRLPATLTIQAESGVFEADDDSLSRSGQLGQMARRRLHDRLWEWLCDQPDPAREMAMQSIRQWAGRGTSQDACNRPMTAAELRALTATGLVDIGAHSVTHRRLSRIPRYDMVGEVERSKTACRDITGREPRCFSFPNGDHDPESVAIVRRAGFESACGSRQELVWASEDAHAMPRIVVRNESGDALVRRLQWEWFA